MDRQCNGQKIKGQRSKQWSAKHYTENLTQTQLKASHSFKLKRNTKQFEDNKHIKSCNGAPHFTVTVGPRTILKWVWIGS
jgi:hypothetical protein